jgi:hypothetical protein
MRLNFNNIGRGLEAIADAKRAQDLARTSAKYDVTEGAYGEGLGQNLQQVIGARDQALEGLGEQATPEQRQQVLDQYTPAMSELSRRVGLQGPDYSVGSGGENYATRQEARMAAAPLRSEALAGVYRQYGDVERADALEARAQELQRGLTAEKRAAAAEDRAAGLYSTNMTKLGFDINAATRADAAAQAEDTRQKENAAWWVQQTTDPETGRRRAPRQEDWLAASQRDAASYFDKGDYTKGGQAFDAFMQRAENMIVKDEKERKRAAESAFAAFNTNRSDESLKLGLEVYNKYLPNGSKATSAKLDKDGMIVMSHTDLSGNKLPDSKVTQKQYLEGLASFGDSKEAMKFVQQSFQNNLALREAGQKDRGLDLQQRNVETNEDQNQWQKIEAIKRGQRDNEKLNKANPQAIKPYKNKETGEVVNIDVTKLRANPDGTVETPRGLVPMTQQTEASFATVDQAARKLMEDRGSRRMVGGKLVPLTYEEAVQKVREGLNTQSGAYMSPEDRIIKLMADAKANRTVESGEE